MNESAPQGRACGHPLGSTRWCPDCALAEDRAARAAAPVAAPSVAVRDIPRLELDALRSAFENTMRDTFGWTNFNRTTDDGYQVSHIQACWFAARCGWRSGASAAPLLGEGGPQPSDERIDLDWLLGNADMVLARCLKHVGGSLERDVNLMRNSLRVAQAALPLPAAVQAEPRQPFKLHPPPVYDEHYAATQESECVHPGAPSSPSAQARPLVQEQGESGQGELPVRAEMGDRQP